MPTFRNRKHYLIDKKLQLTVVGFFTGLGILFGLGIYLAHRVMVAQLLERIATLDPISRLFLEEILALQELAMRNAVVGISLLVIAAMVGGGILLSHKISGPIFVIRRKIREFMEGTPTGPIRLRDQDFFKELAEELNTLMAKVPSPAAIPPLSPGAQTPHSVKTS